jgi:hypothetical protein
MIFQFFRHKKLLLTVKAPDADSESIENKKQLLAIEAACNLEDIEVRVERGRRVTA